LVNGARVYLLSPQGGENMLGVMRKIPVEMKIGVAEGAFPKVEVLVKEKKLSFLLRVAASKPEKYPLTEQQLRVEMQKYSSSIFNLEKVEVTTDTSFVPKSILTKLRQELDERILDFLVPVEKEKKTIPLPTYAETSSTEKKIHVQVYSVEGVRGAMEGGAEVVYYDVFSPDLEQVQEIVRRKQKELYLHTPMVLVDEDMEMVKEIVARIKPDGVLVNNVGVLQLGLKCKMMLGYQMNIFNDQQVLFYGCPAVASVELNAEEVKGFVQKDKIIYYAHGKPAVMTFKEHFSVQGLTDKKGYTFRLRENSTSMEMLYSKTIGILQYTHQLVEGGITQIFLDVEEEVYQLVTLYRRLLNGEEASVREFKEGMTMGNWMKGVM